MTRSILVAEDDQDVRLLLYRLFNDRGYDVMMAKDGREALRYLREFGLPNVIIADHNMPFVTGLDVVREARKHDPEHKTKAILISATHMSTSEDVRELMGVADLMMAKPFDFKQLLTTVERLLDAS